MSDPLFIRRRRDFYSEALPAVRSPTMYAMLCSFLRLPINSLDTSMTDFAETLSAILLVAVVALAPSIGQSNGIFWGTHENPDCHKSIKHRCL